jgi:hypothetical protein
MQFGRTWLLLLLTALLVALSGSALGAQHYFCRMAGRVVADCCCKAEAADPCEKTVGSADCCERIDASARADVSRLWRAADSIPPAALTATITEPAYAPPRARFEPATVHFARGPPIPERLFVVHCAFLI